MLEFLELIYLLRRYIWLIVLTTTITIGVAWYGTLKMDPVYSATVLLRVMTPFEGQISGANYDTLYAGRMMNTYAILVKSPEIRNEVMDMLGVIQQPEIDTEVLTNTELIKIAVYHRDREIAAKAANLISELVISKTQFLASGSNPTLIEDLKLQTDQAKSNVESARLDLMDAVSERETVTIQQANDSTPDDNDSIQIARLDTEVRIAERELSLSEQTHTILSDNINAVRAAELARQSAFSIVSPAQVPSRPIRPNKALNLILSGFIGLVGGIVLAAILVQLDTTIYNAKQISDITSIAILANIPKISKKRLPLVDWSYPESDIFIRLSLSLVSETKSQQVIVTGMLQNEGRSLIVANMAEAFQQMHQKTLIVDCDLRTPSIHKIYDLPLENGLVDLVTGECSITEATKSQSQSNCHILTAGKSVENIPHILSSPNIKTLFNELKSIYDVILIDTPPYLAVSDTLLLAKNFDDPNIVVVVTSGRSKMTQLKKVISNLQLSEIDLSGIVMNRMSPLSWKLTKR